MVNGFFVHKAENWTKNVDNQLALKQEKGGQPANSPAHMYIYMYIYIYIYIFVARLGSDPIWGVRKLGSGPFFKSFFFSNSTGATKFCHIFRLRKS